VHGKWPTKFIEHKNRNRNDNRIENLREADYSKNGANSAVYKNSPTGLKGVVTKQNGKFMAKITPQRKQIYLGTFDSAEEAHKAYRAAADRIYGEFANYG
jgi:hypothetical protein